MDLWVNDDQEQGRAEHGVHLAADEVYRLCVALCDHLMEWRERVDSTGDIDSMDKTKKGQTERQEPHSSS